MALTGTFIRTVTHGSAVAGKMHADSQTLDLLAKAGEEYWRMNYRYGGKQKTLTSASTRL